MDLFYISNFMPGQRELVLSAEESHHARSVLRKKKGAILQLTDGRGHLLSANITDEHGSQLILQVQQQKKIEFPPENLIEIALSSIRPNRMDWAVEKLTELGVQTIVPLQCHYTSYRSLKLDHLRKVAISAMKQSEQVYLPEIKPLTSFESWVKEISETSGPKFFAHLQPKSSPILSTLNRQEKIYIAVGPEGGFHADEIRQAKKSGFEILSLGPTILRTETAAISSVIRLKLLKNL